MNLTLNEKETVGIICEHFDIDPTAMGDVTVAVNRDPFGVTISGIPVPPKEPRAVAPRQTQNAPLVDAERAARLAALRDEGFEATDDAPPPGADGETPPETSEAGSLAAYGARSRDLAAQLDRENPNLNRNRSSGGVHGSQRAPGDYGSEIG